MTRLFLTILFFSLAPCLSWAQKEAIAYQLPTGLSSADFNQNYIIVKLRQPMASTEKGGRVASGILGGRTAEMALGHLNTTTKTNTRLDHHPLSAIYKVYINEGETPLSLINSLRDKIEIEYAEPYFNHRPLFIPDDPEAAPGGNQEYLELIRAYDAWTLEKGDSSIVVGILDTGVQLDHADLIGNLYINTSDPINGIDDDGDGLVDNNKGWDIANNDNIPASDTDSHGSEVAAIGAASTNNNLALAGVGYRSKFMPIKIFMSGSNDFNGGYEAIALAADLGCSVINLSWGSPNSFSQFGQDIINYAVLEKDVVVIAAAGNTNAELDFYPASFENVLSVGASAIDDTKANFATYSHKVDLMAPGKNIYVSTNDSTFRRGQGSSYSAPMVAGTAALLRSRFPDMTAQQIMERLRVSTDDIYNLPGNEPYAGQLGSGRLNMFRALTTVSPSLRIDSMTYHNGTGKHAFYGDTLTISIKVKNHLSSTSSATAKLSCESPYVTVIDSVFAIGSLPSQNTTGNSNSPFSVVLSNNLSPGDTLNFRVDFTDGSYSDFEYFTIESDPDFLTVDNNTTALTVNSRGELGYNKDNFSEGVGLTFYSEKLTDNLGFILAAGKDSVKDNFPTTLATNTRDHDFEALENIKYYRNSLAPIDVQNAFMDATVIEKLNVRIEQKTLAWKDQPDNQYVILEYRLINTGLATITSLHTGLFADWNLNNKDANSAGWDPSHSLGYVKDNASDTLYAGIALLTSQTPFYNALNNKNFDGNSADIPPVLNDTIKYNLVSQGIERTTAGINGMGNDVSLTIGYSIENLVTNDHEKVALALVAGKSLSELQNLVSQAALKYQQYNDMPPLLYTAEVCHGNPAIIDPPQGNTYEFYADVELTTLLQTGPTLTTPAVTIPQTYYVINKDLPYEGNVMRVMAQPKATDVDFSMSNNPLLLDETGNTRVEFTDLSVDGASWSWDFDNGFTSIAQNPIMNFSETGTYTIQLTVTNDIGCTESINKSLEVANRSNKPNITNKDLCKGDEVTLTASNATNLNFYSDEGLTELQFSGSSLNIGPVYQDTVVYVTSTDSTYASNPKVVLINVSDVEAGFNLELDTTDLNKQKLLNLTNRSTNEALYLWYLDGELKGNSIDISYDYEGESSFEVMLIAEDISGCRDSLFRQIIPTMSPRPQVSDVAVCREAELTIEPENGDVFYFYADSQLTNLKSKGSSITLSQVSNDTTIYITAIDSLLESDPVAIHIDVSDLKAAFTLPGTELNLNEGTAIQVSDVSINATTRAWSVNDSLVSTEEEPILNFNRTGEYSISLTVTDNLNCTDSSNQVLNVVSITGLANFENEISIYPNPFTDILHISTGKDIELKIFNTQGIMVREIKSPTKEIDLSNLLPGAYTLEIISSGKSTYRKIIKSR